MDNRAKVEQAVFDFLRPQLKKYREQAEDLARGTANSIVKVTQHAEDVVLERRRRLKRAQAELESCLAQEDANCSGYVRKVEECREALERAVRGRALIEQARSRFQHAQSKQTAAVDQLLVRAGKVVRTADERTISYQKNSNYTPTTTLLSARRLGGGSSGGLAGPDFGGASVAPSLGGGGSPTAETSVAPSWRDLPGVSVPTSFPAGFGLIPIGLVVNDNPVTGPGDFDAGQDVAELRWSTDALIDVVIPAMTTVDDPQSYLRNRDARENLSGGRSYGATYAGFFSEGSAIRLSPRADGTFDLVNGRHRLWLLIRAGADHLPALIGGAR